MQTLSLIFTLLLSLAASYFIVGEFHEQSMGKLAVVFVGMLMMGFSIAYAFDLMTR